MKILCIADNEDYRVLDHWTTARRRYEDVSLILSAGDLDPEYLEFLVTMLNVPCLYVRGNHDSKYEKNPPLGCVCIEDMIVEAQLDPKTGRAVMTEKDPSSIISSIMSMGRRQAARWNSVYAEGTAENADAGEQTAGSMKIRVAGLGGSMRYREGRDMYTEREMSRRVRRLMRRIKPAEDTVDILLTHAPCLGYGDMEDLPHRGFACFNRLLEKWRPAYHCYGHVHLEYGRFKRVTEHPAGTCLINVSGIYILEI